MGRFLCKSIRKNDYVLSVDHNWYDYWINSKNTVPSTYTGNIFEPIQWDAPVVPGVDLGHEKAQGKMTGWSALDTLTLANDKLLLTLGVHGHRAQVRNYNVSTGAKQSDVSSSGICPTVGLVYKITPELNFFANHTENFLMGSVVSTSYENAGEVLDPVKTKSNEFGFKYQHGNVLHTLSFFDMKQANNIDVYEGTKKYLRSDGEQRYKGLEYKAIGKINDKWDFIGGFMYLKATQEKTSKGNYDGLRVNGAPNWQATLGVTYHANDRLDLIFRGVYEGSATINNEALHVPAYMKFDFGATYRTKLDTTPVTITAMCYNLTNKNYWQASSTSNNLFVGSPRTFMLSAAFSL